MCGRDEVGTSVMLWFEFFQFCSFKKGRIWDRSFPQQLSESSTASVAQIAEDCIRRPISHHGFHFWAKQPHLSYHVQNVIKLVCCSGLLSQCILTLWCSYKISLKQKVQWPFLAQISSTDFTRRGTLSGYISSMELLAAAVFPCCSAAIYKEPFQCFNKENAVTYSALRWPDSCALWRTYV